MGVGSRVCCAAVFVKLTVLCRRRRCHRRRIFPALQRRRRFPTRSLKLFFIVSSGQKGKREGEAALRYSREAKSSCRPSSRATHALVMICSRCRSRLVPFTLSITIYPPCNIVAAAASVVVVAIIIKQEKKKSYFLFPTSFPRKNTLSLSLSPPPPCNKKIETPELVVYTIPRTPTQTLLIRRSIFVFNSINPPPSKLHPFITGDVGNNCTAAVAAE